VLIIDSGFQQWSKQKIRFEILLGFRCCKMSRCLEFGASLPSADFLLLKTERLLCVNIQGDSQSRVIQIRLIAISSLSNLAKAPSPFRDGAATISTEWGRHHSIAWHHPRFASPFLFLPQGPLLGLIWPLSYLRRVLSPLGNGLGAFRRFGVAPDQINADFGMNPVPWLKRTKMG
jgi:hypothetical protein